LHTFSVKLLSLNHFSLTRQSSLDRIEVENRGGLLLRRCSPTDTLWNSRIDRIRLFSLSGQHVLDVAATRQDLVESPTDFADGGECG